MKTLLMCSATAIALCAVCHPVSAKPPLPVTHFSGEVHRAISAVPGSVTLYDQNDDDNGVGILSQNFTDGSFQEYDSYAADDFAIPSGHKWKIREIDATGSYDHDGPATSESVVFYKDEKGAPGETPVARCDNINGVDNNGSFAIRIPKGCKIALKGGRRYWLSVIANQDFECCGQWFWETRNGQNGNPAMWENPNGGFGECFTWQVLATCFGYMQGPDFMFAVKGKDVQL